MEAAPLRNSDRRPRPGSLERPINTRLVRGSALVVFVPVLLAALTLGRPGPLPPPALPPSFDGDNAAALAAELATEHPDRRPGGSGSLGSLSWFAEKMAPYGLALEVDEWEEDVPDLGRVTLRNGAAVVDGDTDEAIVFVAHRDNTGVAAGASDNASGTAALVELARFFAAGGPRGEAPRPRQTLVFLSTDAGEFGGLGAARFASTSRFRENVSAVVVLEALSGPGEPRLELAGDGPRSPAPTLVRTAGARLGEELGREPARPGIVRQLVDLGIPFAYGDQAPFLGERISALRVTAADDSGAAAGTDTTAELNAARMERLGRGAQSLLGSLDSGAELARGTSAYVYAGGRVVRGWTIALVLLAAVVPFGVGVVDLLVRCRRMAIPLQPAFAGLLGRLALWLWAAVVLWLAALLGALPTGSARPLPPSGPSATDWRFGSLAALSLLIVVPWLLTRRQRGAWRPPSPEEELAGYGAGLAALGIVALAAAVVNTYSLIFVVPSLYAWLWLPQTGRSWARDVLYGLGFAGPLLALVSLADRFGLGLEVLLYVSGLVTVGYLSWATVVIVLAWGAVAMHVGGVASGRYSLPRADAPPLLARVRAAGRSFYPRRR